jgi:hypothetical protein
MKSVADREPPTEVALEALQVFVGNGYLGDTTSSASRVTPSSCRSTAALMRCRYAP